MKSQKIKKENIEMNEKITFYLYLKKKKKELNGSIRLILFNK